MSTLALRRRTLLATCSTMAIARAMLSHARYEYRGITLR